MGERIKNAANAVIRFIEGSLLAESHDQSEINVQILAEVSVAMRHLRPFGLTFKKIQKLVHIHEGESSRRPGDVGYILLCTAADREVAGP